MTDKVLELERPNRSGEICCVIRGCKISVEPPEGKSLSVNEVSDIFDEAKRAVIKMASMDLAAAFATLSDPEF